MKRWLLVLSILVLAAAGGLFLTACEEEVTGTGMNIPQPDPEVLEAFDVEMAGASQSFGFQLFQQLVKEDENIFISPTSVYTALSMTYNGAREETSEAMAKVLGVEGVELERFNQNNLARLYKLQEADPEVVLNIANSLWLREGKEFDPDFLERNQEYYQAWGGELDFESQEAVDTINGWVKDRTEGLIDKIVEYPINPQTVMFLINAVYFQGDWSLPFDPDNTYKDVFHGPEGAIEEVPFMHQSDDFAYLEKEGEFQAVRLPYGEEERLAMYVFLPDEEQSLHNWINNLSGEKWEQWHQQFRTMEGELHLPRFTMEYEQTLNEALEAMGMEVAFDPQQADFFDMVPRDDGFRIFISEVKHKSFIEVDEEGTEAAAVTSVEMEATSAPPMERFEMKVNRPFFFLIHDRETGEMLFKGAVVDPLS